MSISYPSPLVSFCSFLLVPSPLPCLTHPCPAFPFTVTLLHMPQPLPISPLSYPLSPSLPFSTLIPSLLFSFPFCSPSPFILSPFPLPFSSSLPYPALSLFLSPSPTPSFLLAGDVQKTRACMVLASPALHNVSVCPSMAALSPALPSCLPFHFLPVIFLLPQLFSCIIIII